MMLRFKKSMAVVFLTCYLKMHLINFYLVEGNKLKENELNENFEFDKTLFYNVRTQYIRNLAKIINNISINKNNHFDNTIIDILEISDISDVVKDIEVTYFSDILWLFNNLRNYLNLCNFQNTFNKLTIEYLLNINNFIINGMEQDSFFSKYENLITKISIKEKQKIEYYNECCMEFTYYLNVYLISSLLHMNRTEDKKLTFAPLTSFKKLNTFLLRFKDIYSVTKYLYLTITELDKDKLKEINTMNTTIIEIKVDCFIANLKVLGFTDNFFDKYGNSVEIQNDIIKLYDLKYKLELNKQNKYRISESLEKYYKNYKQKDLSNSNSFTNLEIEDIKEKIKFINDEYEQINSEILNLETEFKNFAMQIKYWVLCNKCFHENNPIIIDCGYIKKYVIDVENILFFLTKIEIV